MLPVYVVVLGLLLAILVQSLAALLAKAELSGLQDVRQIPQMTMDREREHLAQVNQL